MVALTPALGTHSAAGVRAVLTPVEDAAINAALQNCDLRTQLLYILTRRLALEYHQIANLRVRDLWDSNLGQVRAAIDIPQSRRCAGVRQRTIPDAVRALIALLANPANLLGGTNSDTLLFSGRKNNGKPIGVKSAHRLIAGLGAQAGVHGLNLRAARVMGARDYFLSHNQNLAETAQWMGHANLGITGQLIGSSSHEFTRQVADRRTRKASLRRSLNLDLAAQVNTLKTAHSISRRQLSAARARECMGLKTIKRLREELAVTLAPPVLIPRKPWWRRFWPENAEAT